MPLTFAAAPGKWDSFQRVVGFAAQDGESLVMCAVSQEALEDLARKVDMHPGACLDAFEQHRAVIERKASDLYDSGRFRTGEVVMIRASRIP